MQNPPGLPKRSGPKPNTSDCLPHSQLNQNAPVDMQETLWDRMSRMASVETGQSDVSVPGARAVFVLDSKRFGPSCACMTGNEFAHIHPHNDGSLHLTLPEAVRCDAIEKGWAEPHPLAGRDKRAPETVVMVFGPRDRDELETVWCLVKTSHAFATGEIGWTS
ncbi:luciferase family protein [Roseibium aggregatum]|uniref:Phospholipase n=1 Tax=Roseibium aggregatum TaxID=187304 RepID=A0A926S731_9HYPH|nr:luciferase family protein [Roseibium aggregatum]MBD1549203.1 phospholipase [Roseibium aggregatum]